MNKNVSIVLLMMSLVGCHSINTQKNQKTSQYTLAPCPSSPNCVSSLTPQTDSHFVTPFFVKTHPKNAMQALKKVLTQMPRTTIVKQDANYIHATVKSRLLGFVDDVEITLVKKANKHVMQVRSASRLGYSDFGVNKKRIENIRQALKNKQVID